MRILYLGSGEFGIDCLNSLVGSDNELAFIVTQPPNPAGRGQKPRPTPVAKWAKEHSIQYTETDNVNTPQMIEKIAGFAPDLIVVIAFGQKIGSDLIKLPPKAAINVHASLLPKYRGAAPINWAIINGENQTGISIITLAEKMDAGQRIAQAETDIEQDENAGQLHDKLAKLAAPLLIKAIAKIADGSAVYTEQEHSMATLAPKLKKADGLLDFNEPAQALVRRINGLWPWPQASACYLNRKTGKSLRLSIAKAKAIEVERRSDLSVGTFDENLKVICSTGALEILQLKPAGGKLLEFKDFVNGQHCAPGDTLEKITS